MVETAKHRLKFLRPAMAPFSRPSSSKHLSIYYYTSMYFCIVYKLQAVDTTYKINAEDNVSVSK